MNPEYDTTARVRTITLSTHAPVRIREADWPIVSQSTHTDDRGANAEETTWIKIRRHSDGRTVVYGGCDVVHRGLAVQAPALRGGELLPAGGDVVAAIWRLARELDAPALCTREVIAKLPPVEI